MVSFLYTPTQLRMLIAVFKYALLLKITFYDWVFCTEPMIIFMLPRVFEYYFHKNIDQTEIRSANAIYIRPSNGGWVMGYCCVVVSHQAIEIVDLNQNNANVRDHANVINEHNESVQFEQKYVSKSENAIISKLRFFFERVVDNGNSDDSDDSDSDSDSDSDNSSDENGRIVTNI